MPRRYNPRAVAREAKAMRAEEARAALKIMRESRRLERRVQKRLAAIERYGALTNALTNTLVQSRIDEIEFRSVNADRIQAGLPPYADMQEAIARHPV